MKFSKNMQNSTQSLGYTTSAVPMFVPITGSTQIPQAPRPVHIPSGQMMPIPPSTSTSSTQQRHELIELSSDSSASRSGSQSGRTLVRMHSTASSRTRQYEPRAAGESSSSHVQRRYSSSILQGQRTERRHSPIAGRGRHSSAQRGGSASGSHPGSGVSTGLL